MFALLGQHGNVVFSNKLNVFSLDSHSTFGLLQSRIHEAWVHAFSSTLKDDLAYTPTDCFENFPFPLQVEQDVGLETVSKAYNQSRADMMLASSLGLTKTYNRFHDPTDTAADIVELLRLHDDMDRAVLRAYGWKASRSRPAEHLTAATGDDPTRTPVLASRVSRRVLAPA